MSAFVARPIVCLLALLVSAHAPEARARATADIMVTGHREVGGSVRVSYFRVSPDGRLTRLRLPLGTGLPAAIAGTPDARRWAWSDGRRVRAITLRSDGRALRPARSLTPVRHVYGAGLEFVAWSPSARRLLVSAFLPRQQSPQLLIFNRAGQRIRALPLPEPVSEFPIAEFPWVDDDTLAVSYGMEVDGTPTSVVGLIDLRRPSPPTVITTGATLTGLRPVDPTHQRALVSSPDGRRLAVLDLRTRRRIGVPTSRHDSHTSASWAPDGRSLLVPASGAAWSVVNWRTGRRLRVAGRWDDVAWADAAHLAALRRGRLYLVGIREGRPRLLRSRWPGRLTRLTLTGQTASSVRPARCC